MQVVAAIFITFIVLYLFWFFWGGFVQYFSSPTQTPKTKSKSYWLLALVLVMELYDFVYMITFPAILGVMTLAMLVAILTVRIRKQTMPKLFQVLGAAIFLAWVGSHILGVIGAVIGGSLGVFTSLVSAPWGGSAAEMWDEPWWAPQAYKKRKG